LLGTPVCIGRRTRETLTLAEDPRLSPGRERIREGCLFREFHTSPTLGEYRRMRRYLPVFRELEEEGAFDPGE
jgi:hypothetical protein